LDRVFYSALSPVGISGESPRLALERYSVWRAIFADAVSLDVSLERLYNILGILPGTKTRIWDEMMSWVDITCGGDATSCYDLVAGRGWQNEHPASCRRAFCLSFPRLYLPRLPSLAVITCIFYLLLPYLQHDSQALVLFSLRRWTHFAPALNTNGVFLTH